MKSWTGIFARLYPRAWRQRYGAEFEALLEDAGADWRHLPDLIQGALTMHFTTMNWRAVTAFAGVGLLVAAVMAWQTPRRYVSEAVVRFEPAPGTDNETEREEIQRIERNILSRTSLATIIQKPDLNLYLKERARQPIEDVIATMKARDLKFRFDPPTPGNGASVVRISFAGEDPRVTQEAARKFAARMIDEHNNNQRALGRLMAEHLLDPSDAVRLPIGSVAELAASAGLPARSSGPNLWLMGLGGLAAGLFVWAVTLATKRWPRTGLGIGLTMILVAVATELVVAEQFRGFPIYYDSTAVLVADSLETLRSLARSPGAGVRIEIQGERRTPALIVRTRDTDRFRAQRMAQLAITGMMDENQRQRRARQAKPWTMSPSLDVLDPPSLSVTPDLPLPGGPVFGAGLALTVVSLFFLLTRRRARTIAQA